MEYTQEYLNECFSYNGETGLLQRKSRPLSHFKSALEMRSWNAITAKKSGSINKTGYFLIRLNGKKYYSHRIIFMLAHGYCPAILDHADGNKLNNRLSNIREATKANNAHNQGMHSTNTSGYKGVHWNKQRGKWVAQIRLNYKSIYLGCFQDKENASAAYCKAAKELHGEFANFG